MTTATVTAEILDPRVDWAIRRLSARDYSTETRMQAFQRLAEWDGTPNCRVALQAIVSCAMQPESPLFTDAQLYLKDHPDHWIVSLQEASRSLEARRMINQELGDRGLMKSLFQGPYARLWHDILEENELTGSPVEVSTRFIKWPDLPADNTMVLLPHPYPGEHEAWEACLMVQENLPDHMRLHEIAEILEDVTLMAHPLLQRRILLCLPAQGEPPEALVSLLAHHLDRLWPELERIIALGDGLYLHAGLGGRQEAIAAVLKRGFARLTHEQQDWLAKQQNLWTWSLLPELVETLKAKGDQTAIVELIARFLPDRNIKEKDKLTGGNLITFLRNLPAPVNLAVLETLRDRQDTFVYYLLLWLFPREKAAWQEYYGPLVAAGVADIYSVVSYLEIVGEAGKEQITGWLEQADDTNRMGLDQQSQEFSWEKLVRKAVVPWNLRIGRWLVSSHDALANFTKWGYTLTSEDLERLSDPVALLPLVHDRQSPGRTVPLPWVGWRSSSTRLVFLDFLKTRLGVTADSDTLKHVVRSLVISASADAVANSHDDQTIKHFHRALDDCERIFPTMSEWLSELLDASLVPTDRDWAEHGIKLFLLGGLVLWYERASGISVMNARDAAHAKFRERIEQDPHLVYELMEHCPYQQALKALFPSHRQTELLLDQLWFFGRPVTCVQWIKRFKKLGELGYVVERLHDCFRILVLPELLEVSDGRNQGGCFISQWLEWATHFPEDPEIRACVRYYLARPDYRRVAEQIFATPTTP